jgi:hypothetical protein
MSTVVITGAFKPHLSFEIFIMSHLTFSRVGVVHKTILVGCHIRHFVWQLEYGRRP